jgi:hypothetical protein
MESPDFVENVDYNSDMSEFNIDVFVSLDDFLPKEYYHYDQLCYVLLMTQTTDAKYFVVQRSKNLKKLPGVDYQPMKTHVKRLVNMKLFKRDICVSDLKPRLLTCKDLYNCSSYWAICPRTEVAMKVYVLNLGCKLSQLHQLINGVYDVRTNTGYCIEDLNCIGDIVGVSYELIVQIMGGYKSGIIFDNIFPIHNADGYSISTLDSVMFDDKVRTGKFFRHVITAGIPSSVVVSPCEFQPYFPGLGYDVRPDLHSVYTICAPFRFMWNDSKDSLFADHFNCLRLCEISDFTMGKMLSKLVDGWCGISLYDVDSFRSLIDDDPRAVYPLLHSRNGAPVSRSWPCLRMCLAFGEALVEPNLEMFLLLGVISRTRGSRHVSPMQEIDKILVGWMVYRLSQVLSYISPYFGRYANKKHWEPKFSYAYSEVSRGSRYSFMDVRGIWHAFTLTDNMQKITLPKNYNPAHLRKARFNCNEWWIWDDIACVDLVLRHRKNEKSVKLVRYAADVLKAFYDDLWCSLIMSDGRHRQPCFPPHTRCYNKKTPNDKKVYIDLENNVVTRGEMMERLGVDRSVEDGDCFPLSFSVDELPKDRITPGRTVNLLDFGWSGDRYISV